MNLGADIRRLVALGPVVPTASDVLAVDLVDRPEPMWERSRFRPGHFTASGFVASPDGTALLLIEHGRLGRWLQPGGHFESGDESVEGAARREVHEETGLSGMAILSGRLLRIDAHAIPARSDEPAHTHYDLAMAFRSATWDIGPIAEVLDARWVPLDGLQGVHTDAAVRCGAAALEDLLRG